MEIQQLTAEQEDYLLEEARESYFERKAEERLGENGLCQFCGKDKAEVPITDSETLEQVWICEGCDEMLFE